MHVEGAAPHATQRKLVHWLNSLPLTACLLVDELDELRFGDALAAVVAWIQEGLAERHDALVGDDARACVTRVVQFAAQKCRADDGDALHVVNSAECVRNVLRGDVAAIAAVVLVLKRVVEQMQRDKRSREMAEARSRRESVVQAIDKRNGAFQNGNQEETRSPESQRAANDRALSRRRREKKPTKTQPTGSRGHSPLTESLARVAPVVRKKENIDTSNATLSQRVTPSTTSTVVIDSKCKTTQSILGWMSSLGISLQSHASAATTSPATPTFKDGVLLCALAAVVARRRGSIAIRHKLHTIRTEQHPRGVLFPRGATLNPRTKAEKRHNLATAWTLLKDCGVLTSSAASIDVEGFVELVSEKEGEQVLTILEHIKAQCQRNEVHKMSTSLTRKPLLAKGTTESRRPYITAEQIDAARRWMKSVGVDPFEQNSSGVLDDPLRSGVALCQLLIQVNELLLLKPVFKNPPKTLLEVRRNHYEAINVLATLGEDKIPRVYLTRQAMEGMILGDTQYIYGLVWHLMQSSKDAEVRQSHFAGLDESTSNINPRSPTIVEQKPLSLRPQRKPLTVSPISLDVPAHELVEDRLLTHGPCMSEAKVATPWNEADILEDIYPRCRRPKPRRFEVGESDEEITPQNPPRDFRGLSPRFCPKSNDQRTAENCGILHQTVRESDKQALEDFRKIDQPSVDVLELPRESRSPIASQILAETTSESRPRSEVEDQSGTSVESRVHSCQTVDYTDFSRTKVIQVIQWLKSLGVELVNPAILLDPKSSFEEFRSGVLLCSIVEKLEHMRCIEGVCRDQKVARANALHNIDKAFDVLQHKKRLPLHFFRRRAKIYEGDRSTILSLLIHVRKAYGHHARPRAPVKVAKSDLPDVMPKSTRKSKAKTSESSLPSTPDQWTRLQESLYGLLSVEIDDPFTDLDHLCPRSAWLVLHMDLILPTQPAQPLSLLVERALDALAVLCVQSESLRIDEAEYEGYWQRVLSCDMMKEPLSKTDPLVYKFARFARCKGVRVLLSWRRKKLQASTIKALSNFLCSRREKYREYFLPPSRLSLKSRCVLVGLRLAECNLATKDVAAIQELLVARPSSVDCSLLCDQESLGCLDLEGNRLGPEELSSLASLLEKSVRQVNGIGLKDTVPDDPVKSTSPKYIQAFKGFLAEAFKSKKASTRNDPVSRIDEGVALSLAGNTLCDGVHLQVLYEVLQGASRPLRALSLAGTTHTVSPAGSIADLVTQKIFAKLCFLSPATSFTEDSTLDMSATKSDFIFKSMDVLHESLQDPILRLIPLVQAALESGETVWCRVRYNDPRWWAKYAYYIEPSLEQNTRASGVWVDPSTAMKVVSIRSDGWLQVEVPQCDDNGEESTSSTPTIRILWIQVSKLSALYSHSLDILGMRFRGIICNSNGDGRSHRSNHLELLRELTESCVPIVTRLCLRQWNHKRYYLGRIVDRCPQLQEFDVQGSKIDNYPLNVSAATVINLSGCELSSNFFEDLLECDENTLFRHRYLSLLDTKLDDAQLPLLQKAIERFTNLVLVDADSIATIKAISEVGFGYGSVSACETEILREVVSKARRFPPEVIENIISQTNGVSVSLRVRSCTLSPLPQWRIQAQDGQKS